MQKSIPSITTLAVMPAGVTGAAAGGQNGPSMEPEPLRFYNSWSRRVEEFESIDPGQVRMYSCGLTVYSRGHLGNLRPYVFADILRRTLAWRGYSVDHVINITDVGHLLADADDGDDKVEAAALRERRSVWELTEHYQRLFEEDRALLAIAAPRVWTKATDYVGRMIEFAKVLEDKGHAYRLASGLYFDTSSIDDYGVLATTDPDGNEAGARVEVVEDKRQPSDFALWRTFDPAEPPKAMEWDSPWGRGAPGWHLECSVMSIAELGPHFDIHTGGIDHREIHHPNEDAQSRAYLGDGLPWVRYWMHNEFIQLAGTKMSKSVGNVMSLDDVTGAGYEPLSYRLLLLQSHYRSQIKIGIDDIGAADAFLSRLVRAVEARLDNLSLPAPTLRYDMVAGAALVDEIDRALADDLSTPRAVATLAQAVRDPDLPDADLALVLGVARDLLGLDLAGLAEHRRSDAGEAIAVVGDDRRSQIEALVAEREAARVARDFAAADVLRTRLRDEFGVEVVDAPTGATWSVIR